MVDKRFTLEAFANSGMIFEEVMLCMLIWGTKNLFTINCFDLSNLLILLYTVKKLIYYAKL